MTNKEKMTNKEAKDVLQEQIDRYGQEYDAEGIEALEIAINVLEQQPCEDCISRQAAIDVVRKWFDKIQLNGDICLDGIISLPSITSQLKTCEDAISRAAIYEALSEWDEQDVYLPYHFKELVAELPSVMPEAEWIPISERLPEPLTAVLLTVRYKATGHWTYQMGYWEDTLERWEKWLEPGTLEEEFEIIAWMELPEKYEEDNDEW